MHSSLDETKRKVHHLTEQIKTDSWEGVENSLLELILEIQKGQLELANTTPRNSDLALIIQEMKAGFARQDQRFDDLIHQMDRRFEQVDKRFELVERRFEQVDKRFEQIDKRFEDLIHQMDKRFEQVDRRFEQVDRRFEQVDKRFEQVDKRFDQMERNFKFLQWFFGAWLTIIGTVLTYGTFFK
jgi:uncharacterized protein (DUF3084 family)